MLALRAVATTLHLLRQPETIHISISDSITVRDFVPAMALKDKSARATLVEIAKRNGGIVRITDAKAVLIGAGILKNTKNVGGIYTTLSKRYSIRLVRFD
jgi:hypothetical protein